jgi:hypothetical protein
MVICNIDAAINRTYVKVAQELDDISAYEKTKTKFDTPGIKTYVRSVALSKD